jgi:hypothetical protein
MAVQSLAHTATTLAPTVVRLSAWLDANCRAGQVAREWIDLPSFGVAYVSIDEQSTARAASFNLNRVYLCAGAEVLSSPSGPRLIEMFTTRGISRFFVWLSPPATTHIAPDAPVLFNRVEWTEYPTLVRDLRDPPPVNTRFDVREVSAAEVANARGTLGEAMWPEYAACAGKSGFHHFMAFDSNQPVAVALLAVFEGYGYLTFASTLQTHRCQGAQQALINMRIRKARQLSCKLLVSETLTMLPHSLTNLQRAGFVPLYQKLVYEWVAPSVPGSP